MARFLLVVLVLLSALTIASRFAEGGVDPSLPGATLAMSDSAVADTTPTPPPVPRSDTALSPTPPSVPRAVPQAANVAPSATPTIARMARIESRRRLVQSARYTYLDSLFTTPDSLVRRWLDRPRSPIRVAFVLPDSLSSQRDRLTRAAMTGLDRWANLGLGLSFRSVADSSEAEIVVTWISQFGMDRSGQADIQFSDEGLIANARITLALNGFGGRRLTDQELAIVATHEVGHALGLPHSGQMTDVMFPTARLDGLSSRDRATLTLLYALVPGSLREPMP